MMDMLSKRFLIPIMILVALASYLFFFQLGNLALTDPDETFYAETAKEMLKRGEWLTPYLYGVPQFEKPILFYWLVQISYRIFGVNEAASRLPSAIFGLIGVLAVYLLGGILFNKRTGFFASLILATNVEYIILSRACVTDMVLGTFMLLGFLFFFYAHIREKSSFYLLSSASFALATLTKGPIGIFLPGVIIVLYLLMTRDFKIFKDALILFWAAVIFFSIALPWFLIMYRLHGTEFIDVFFGFHNIARFLEPEHEIGSQFYYYIPVALVTFFPWSAFAPFGFWHIFKKIQNSTLRLRSGLMVSKAESSKFKIQNLKLETRGERAHSIFLLLWFFMIFIFFSMSSTKLPTYIFPSFAALALITAKMWDDFLKADSPHNLRRGIELSYYLLVAASLLAGIGLYIFMNRYHPKLGTRTLALSLFSIFGFSISLATFINSKFIASFLTIVISAASILYPLNKLVIPEIGLYESTREVSRKLSSLIKDDEPIGAESHYVAGLTFYTGRIVTDVDKHHVLVRFLSQDKRVWCVLKEKNFIQLYELDHKPYYTKPSYMVYKLGKKCIITNRIPDDGAYLTKREGRR